MKLRQYDDFNAAAGTSLGTKSYWTTTGTWTELGNSIVEYAGTMNLDAQAVHQTDANLGLPTAFEVEVVFHVDVGVKYLGVLGISDVSGTATDRIEVRWREDYGQQIEIRVPGFADLIVPTPNLITYGSSTYHTLKAVFSYQAMNNGKPEFIVLAYWNGVLKAATPPRRLAYFVAANHFAVGMTARRETFGVPNPTIKITRFVTRLLSASFTHEPAPEIEAAVARTPIVTTTETPNASPATFPFEIKVAEVVHRRKVARFLADVGLEIRHAQHSQTRRLFSCEWIGTKTDKDTLEAFFDTVLGAEDNFQVTIRAMSIGTVDVCFGGFAIPFTEESHNVWRTKFVLVELF